MKLGIHTAFWKRWNLSRVFVDYWSNLVIPGVEVVRAASYSYDGHEWKWLLDRAGWRSVQVPNRPVGRKLNRSLELLDDCDAVLAIGSDDFVSRGWIRLGLRRLENAHMVGADSIYIYSPVLDRLLYFRGVPTGAARFYRRDMLEALKWTIWNNGRDRGLDGSVWERVGYAMPELTSEVVDDIRSRNIMIVDVKTGDPDNAQENITTWHRIVNKHGDNYVCDPATMERYFGTNLAKRIRECQ